MKPVHGYPSRTAAIRDLYAKGLTTSEIASRLGISASYVSALRNGAKRAWGECGDGTSEVKVANKVLTKLIDEAARRGVSPRTLARDILEVVTRDDLFVAVLGKVGAEDA